MKTLYFDCFSGASGDMILGALFDLGVDASEVARQIESLGLQAYSITPSKVDRSGITATYAGVSAPDERKHRHLSEIERMIEGSSVGDGVKAMSLKIFRRLGEAEAKIHNLPVEKVHFHEVGALDSIIDIVGACIGFEALGVERFMCSTLEVGGGFAQMAHGRFPVPPPAVSELLAGFRISSGSVEGELLTPTAAAIISTLCKESGGLDGLEIVSTGYGAGTKQFEKHPNVLRLMLGRTDAGMAAVASSPGHAQAEKLIVLETNLDDVSPEILGYVMETAFEKGALDCWFAPIQMKKNRPATLLSLLCEPNRKSDFMELLVRETPTLGVRVREVERICLTRETTTVDTRFGRVPVKIAKFGDRVTNAKPEYEAMKVIAQREGVPLRDVEAEIIRNIESRWRATAGR